MNFKKNNISIYSRILFNLLLEYKDNILFKLLNKIKIKPWMKTREIEIIEQILINLKPSKVLEWGAGYGTLYFPNLIPLQSIYISIEHDKDWNNVIANMNKNKGERTWL